MSYVFWCFFSVPAVRFWDKAEWATKREYNAKVGRLQGSLAVAESVARGVLCKYKMEFNLLFEALWELVAYHLL
jgi:hypothetical protein